jgi:poly-gamma-glutamate capsule biosynthesis protein CapA/YwtB (metallophosphatase superfamily)
MAFLQKVSFCNLIRNNPWLYPACRRKKIVILFASLIYLNFCSTIQKQEKIVNIIKFSVVGDIMVHSTQLDKAFKKDCKCWDFNSSFSKIYPYLKNSDYSIANLETTLPGNISEYSGYPQFGTPDSILDAIKRSGFSILTTSNNHCMDKGKKALVRTIQEIKKRGLLSTGTFESESERMKNRFLTLEKNGFKIGLLSYTYSTNGITIPKDVSVNLINKEKISEDILYAKNSGIDTIIVYFHFGNEYERLPDKNQKEIVNFTFWEGADIVLGGHPHVLQPFELKSSIDKYGYNKKRLVIYSLGNFISSQSWRYSNGGVIFNFSLVKNNDKISIEEVHFEPVFVYRDITSQKYEFIVLPAKEYLQEENINYLKPEARKQMLEFYKDTVEHLTKNSYVEK